MHTSVVILLFIAVAVSQSWAETRAAVMPTPEASYAFAIAPSPLPQALQALAQQTGHALLVSTALLPTERQVELQGEWTLQQALLRLLSGTDLQATIQGQMILLTAVTATTPVAMTRPPSAATPRITPAAIERITIQSVRARDHQLAHQPAQSHRITAEAIAFTPQKNIGDSLQRLPGMVAERDNGETRQLGLRGLGANFVQVQINGVETLATMNSIFDHRGSAERSRTFDFNIFAAGLFQQVEVQTNYHAAQEPGGIAGTINLMTADPFAAKEGAATLSLTSAWNDLSQRFSPDFAATLQHQTERFAASFAVSYQGSTTFETGYRDWGWRPLSSELASEHQVTIEAQQRLQQGQAIAPSVASSTFASRTQQRVGGYAGWGWRPHEQIDLTMTHLYARLQSDDLEYNLANQESQALRDIVLDRWGTVQFAHFERANIRSEAKRSEVNSDYHHHSLQARIAVSEWQQLRAFASYSASVFDSPVHDKVFLQAPAQSYSFDFRQTKRAPNLEYGASLNSPTLWQLHRLDVREDQIKNAFQLFGLESQFELPSGATWTVGLHTKHFNSKGYERRDDVRSLNARQLPFAVAPRPLAQSPDFLVADVEQSFALLNDIPLIGRLSGQPFGRSLSANTNRFGTDFTLKEQQDAFFSQYAMATTAWSATIGARWVNTQIHSVGVALPGALESRLIAEPASLSMPTAKVQRHYHLLPTLSLAWMPASAYRFRLHANRNLARPNISQLRPTADVSIADNRVIQANSAIQPWLATSFEFGIEYRRSTMDTISAAFFYKQLHDFIRSDTSLVPFAALGLPSALLTEDRRGQLFALSKPEHGETAYLRGFELTTQFAWPSGFGIQSNYTYAEGHTQYRINQRLLNAPLLDLSRHTAHLRLFYQSERTGISLSASVRDRYLTDVDAINDFQGVNASQLLDAAWYLQVTPPLKISLAALNLTDAPIDMFVDPMADRPLVFTRSGRTFRFGLHWQF